MLKMICKSEGYIIVAGPVQDNLIVATGFFPFKPQSDKKVEGLWEGGQGTSKNEKD